MTWPLIYEQLLAHLREKWPDGRGVREFVRILKLHRDHPADRIAQAVAQALEYGCAHADGVRLCLRQLTPPRPLASLPRPEPLAGTGGGRHAASGPGGVQSTAGKG